MVKILENTFMTGQYIVGLDMDRGFFTHEHNSLDATNWIPSGSMIKVTSKYGDWTSTGMMNLREGM